MKEALSFIQQGLKDFSISRLKSKMPWGVPVPNNPDHVMYVWFDALVNYVSTLGWPKKDSRFANFWPGVQVAGKDNLRQQAIMWQAMLLSAGLPNSEKILINGFISIEGQKMSKSLGNVITPKQMVERYGSDSTRLLLTSLGTFGEDMDVSWQRLDEFYTANLANGLGNLCSRVAKMAANKGLEVVTNEEQFEDEFHGLMNQYQLTQALELVLSWIANADQFLSKKKPWELSGEAKLEVLREAVSRIRQIALHLTPFMPETSQTILSHFQGKIEAIKPLFPRLEK